eukprot:205157_1
MTNTFLLLILSSFITSLNALNWTYFDSSLPEEGLMQSIGISPIGEIYLFGGHDTNVIWKWDGFLSSTFHEIHNFTNLGISQFWNDGQGSTSINHLVYFIGVYDGTANLKGPYSGIVYIYDMNRETFIQSNNTPQAMLEPSIVGCVASNDEYIFYLGGLIQRTNTNVFSSNKIQILDISTGIWLNHMPILPRKISRQSCIIVNDFLYSFGGSHNSKYYADIYRFDTMNFTSNATNLTISLSQPRHKSKAIIGPDEMVYIIGGESINPILTTDIFDPINEQITIDSNHLLIDTSAANIAIACNSNIMILGGGDAAIQMSNKIPILDEINFQFDEIYPGSKLSFIIDDFYIENEIEILLYNDLLYINEQIKINLYANDTYECVLISNNRKCENGLLVDENMTMLNIDNNEYILYMQSANIHIPPYISLYRKIQTVNVFIHVMHFGSNIKVDYEIANNETIVQSESEITIKSAPMGLNAYININYNKYDNDTKNYECIICDVATVVCELCNIGLFISMDSKLINTKQSINLTSMDSYLYDNDLIVSILPCRIGTTCVGSKCIECPYNEYNIRSGDNCTECDQNDAGYECLGGSNIIVAYNHWINIKNFSNHSHQIFNDPDNDKIIISVLCPIGYCCTPVNTQYPYCNYTEMKIINSRSVNTRRNTLCAFGRDPDVILCGECLPGYAEVFGSDQCGECEDNYWLLLLPLFMALPYVFALGYNSFRPIKRKKNTDIDIDDITDIDIDSDIADIVTDMTYNDNDSNIDIKQQKSAQDYLRRLIKTDAKTLKLILFRPLTIFFQSLFIICSQYGLQWYLLPFVRLFMLDVLLVKSDGDVQHGICLTSDLDAIAEQLWYLFFPICIFIWLLILKVATSTTNGNVNLFYCCIIGLRFDNAFWNTVIISIGIIASKIFMFVSCQDVGSLYVHFYFGNHECHDTIWFASLIVILIIIISFIYIWYKLYKMDVEKRQSSKQFLYFLIKPYKQDLWFYEFIIIARRIFLTFTVTFSVSLRNVCIAVVLTCSFFLQIKCRPFKSGRVNQFETMGIFLALIALFFVGFINNSDKYNEILPAVLFLITFIPIAIFLFHLIKFIKRSIEVCRNQHVINNAQKKRVIRMLDKESLSTKHRYMSSQFSSSQLSNNNNNDDKKSLINFDYHAL